MNRNHFNRKSIFFNHFFFFICDNNQPMVFFRFPGKRQQASHFPFLCVSQCISNLNCGRYDLKNDSLSRDITNLLNKVKAFLERILEEYEKDELVKETLLVL